MGCSPPFVGRSPMGGSPPIGGSPPVGGGPPRGGGAHPRGRSSAGRSTFFGVSPPSGTSLPGGVSPPGVRRPASGGCSFGGVSPPGGESPPGGSNMPGSVSLASGGCSLGGVSSPSGGSMPGGVSPPGVRRSASGDVPPGGVSSPVGPDAASGGSPPSGGDPPSGTSSLDGCSLPSGSSPPPSRRRRLSGLGVVKCRLLKLCKTHSINFGQYANVLASWQDFYKAVSGARRRQLLASRPRSCSKVWSWAVHGAARRPLDLNLRDFPFRHRGMRFVGLRMGQVTRTLCGDCFKWSSSRGWVHSKKTNGAVTRATGLFGSKRRGQHPHRGEANVPKGVRPPWIKYANYA